MKRTIFMVAALLVARIAFSQNDPKLPEVVPPSPTVANLMKFEEVPIDYYSGQPNISIPLFSKQIGKGIGFNLALSYSTTGIQIDSRSGWTGTGWSLFAGGSVSRTVRDVPDEAQKGQPGFTTKTGIFHNANYWSYSSLSPTAQAEFNWKAFGSSLDKYDINQDLFQFNFMGYSGRFVVVKELGSLKAKMIGRNNKFDVSISYDSMTYEIDSLVIKDPNGYKYTFNEVEVTTTATSSESMSQQQGTSTTGTSSQYSFNSAWHLTKIQTPNGDDLATLSYSTTAMNEGYGGIPSKTETRLTGILGGGIPLATLIANDYNNGIMEPYYAISQNTNTAATRKLSSITFRDGTSVSMVNASGHPEYGTGGSKLQDVILKDESGTEYKRYTFTYETVESRLWLSKVSEIAGGETLDTHLNYYDRTGLPNYGEAFDQGDSWGYYSGIDDVHNVNNPFDVDQIKTGLLSSIEYPTGGVKEFEFEHNSYSYYSDQVLPQADYMENPNNVNVITDNVIDYRYTQLTSPSPEQIKNGLTAYTFTLDFQQTIYISSFIDFANSNTAYLSYHQIRLENTSGTIYAYIPLGEVGTVVSNLPSGTYRLMFAPTGTEVPFPYDIEADYRIEYKEEASTIKQAMIGGGVRIKSVKFKDNPLASVAAKQINYIYDVEGDATKSSGVIDAYGDRVKRNYSKDTSVHLFLDANSENTANSFLPATLQYDVIQYGPNMNTQMTKGNFVGYGHVKVEEVAEVGPGLTETNGYSLYDYTTAYDYPNDIAVFAMPNTKPSKNIDYKRGLMTKQRIYDVSGRKLKEVTNAEYSFVEDFIYTERAAYRPNCNEIQFHDKWSFYTSNLTDANSPVDALGNPILRLYPGCGINPINMQSTSYTSGWAQLKETVTKDYLYHTLNAADSTVVTSKKTYTYNGNNYQIASETSYMDESSTEIRYQTNYYYPVDGLYGGNTQATIDDLTALNKVNEVLETSTLRYVGSGPSGESMNATKTLYSRVGGDPDLVYPSSVKTKKGTGSDETRIEYHKYDAYGNPLEVSQKDGTHIVYIWGYNKTLPVAKIENATYAQVEALSYFGSNFTIVNGLSSNQENSLRSSLTNAMVTTFEYDPAVGVTKITDPRGNTSTFEYDAFNRLKYVKDRDGNIVTENQYHYKN